MAYASLHCKFCEITVFNIPYPASTFWSHCRAICDGDTKKKTKKRTIPTLHTCTSCFIQGGGQDGERTLHLYIVFWSNYLLFIRLKFITPFCHYCLKMFWWWNKELFSVVFLSKVQCNASSLAVVSLMATNCRQSGPSCSNVG